MVRPVAARRCAPACSTLARRFLLGSPGQADVGGRQHDGNDGDPEHGDEREQRLPDEPRSLAASCGGRRRRSRPTGSPRRRPSRPHRPDGLRAPRDRPRPARRRPGPPRSPGTRAATSRPRAALGQDPHRLIRRKGRHDERSPEARADPWRVAIDQRRAWGPPGRSRGRPTRAARRSPAPVCPAAMSPGARSSRSAAAPTDSRRTTISPASIAAASTAMPSQSLVDLERDGLPRVFEGDPAAAAPGLEPGSPEDERAVVEVLELLLGVDPAVDPDVAGPAARRDREGLIEADRRGRGQQPADPETRAEGRRRIAPPATTATTPTATRRRGSRRGS